MTIPVGRDEIIDMLGGDDPEWVAAAYNAVEEVARHQATLTTDDLWPLVRFPAGYAGGRAMGKVIRWALANRIVEKATSEGYLLCLDHTTVEPVHTRDGSLVRHQRALVLYRSLIHSPADAGLSDDDEVRGLTVSPDRSHDERLNTGQADV